MLEMIGPARPARQSLTFGSLGVTSAAEAPDHAPDGRLRCNRRARQAGTSVAALRRPMTGQRVRQSSHRAPPSGTDGRMHGVARRPADPGHAGAADHRGRTGTAIDPALKHVRPPAQGRTRCRRPTVTQLIRRSARWTTSTRQLEFERGARRACMREETGHPFIVIELPSKAMVGAERHRSLLSMKDEGEVVIPPGLGLQQSVELLRSGWQAESHGRLRLRLGPSTPTGNGWRTAP